MDDFVDFGATEHTRKKFELEFGSRFNVEFQGQAHWYFASRISQDQSFNITIDQSRYAKSIVQCYLEPAGVNKCAKEYSSILPTSFVPSKKDCPETPEESSIMQQEFNVDYASCVGSLIYISNTHPDMTYGINKLAKFSRNPGQVHMLALIHLLRYLCQHTQFGLTYYSN